MALFVLFAVFVLGTTSVHVAGQPGFLSIDCGMDDRFSGFKSPDTGIVYVSDGPYVDSGENHRVAADQSSNGDDYLLTLRSFPSGVRNCYTLPTEKDAKYLVRMEFFYGNYDGKNSSSVKFDLHLGVDYWDTYDAASDWYYWSEAVFIALASWASVCLVNIGAGTPFVSSVDLRPLGSSLYPPVTTYQSMNTYARQNMGAKDFTRFPADPYDRFWYQTTNSSWANLSTSAIVQVNESSFAVPMSILQTAVTTTGNDTVLTVYSWEDSTPSDSFMVILHFADFQNSLLRQFTAYINQETSDEFSPSYLAQSSLYSYEWDRATDGKYNITLAATATSVLPPMINAYEIYNLITHDNPTTLSKDFETIMAIKLEYGVKKNWNGDPCFPASCAWEGVRCRNSTGNTMMIISVDLSKSNLHGIISDKFSLLTSLEYLDLSGNRLSGTIPDALCKSNSGSLVFRYDSDENVCNKTISPSPSSSGNKTAILSISIIAPVLVVVVLVSSYLIWRRKTKPKTSTHDSSGERELGNAAGSRKSHSDQLLNPESRRFTYKELEKVTNKFELFIGQGGFGPVYYGRLEDGTEVAVKIRSETSTHGLDEFLAEVQSLTKVHHRNLVSLVGYCREKDHLALVYEYMSGGNLCDHLRGQNGVAGNMNWGTRVQVVLEAAQGLDYLHKGCSLPIIHRDVKTSNILLGQNMQTKIADFGLCKTYLSDTQTHISTNAAGSAGYFDPEYYQTGRLTESSDVYCFGVVLLEIATGEPPIVPSHGHIVQRVKQKIVAGNISSVADARLGGAYDVSSMWKVIDTAMACTSDTAIRRPTMAAVVAQLKESLALEEAREHSGVGPSVGSDFAAIVSTFGPSAR